MPKRKRDDQKTIIVGGSPEGGGAIGPSTGLYRAREPKRCPHCRSKAAQVSCVNCNRDMCEDCISLHSIGKVCGLCYDRLYNPEDD